MAREQLGQPGNDEVARDEDGDLQAHPSPQRTTRLKERRDLLRLREKTVGPLQQLLSLGRGAHDAGRALEELGSQLGLELLHVRGRARLGHAELVGGLREAAQLRHPDEDPE